MSNWSGQEHIRSVREKFARLHEREPSRADRRLKKPGGSQPAGSAPPAGLFELLRTSNFLPKLRSDFPHSESEDNPSGPPFPSSPPSSFSSPSSSSSSSSIHSSSSSSSSFSSLHVPSHLHASSSFSSFSTPPPRPPLPASLSASNSLSQSNTSFSSPSLSSSYVSSSSSLPPSVSPRLTRASSTPPYEVGTLTAGGVAAADKTMSMTSSSKKSPELVEPFPVRAHSTSSVFQMPSIPQTRSAPPALSNPLPYPTVSSSSGSSIHYEDDRFRPRNDRNDPFSTSFSSVMAELKSASSSSHLSRGKDRNPAFSQRMGSTLGRPTSSPEKSRNDEMWKAIDDLNERVLDLEDKLAEVLKLHRESVHNINKTFEDNKMARQKIDDKIKQVQNKVDNVVKISQQEISKIEAKVFAKSLYETKTQSWRDYRSQFFNLAPGWFLLGLMTVIEPLRRILNWFIGILTSICYRQKALKDPAGARSPLSSPLHGSKNLMSKGLGGSSNISPILMTTNLKDITAETSTPRPRRRMSVVGSPTLTEAQRDELRGRGASF